MYRLFNILQLSDLIQLSFIEVTSASKSFVQRQLDDYSSSDDDDDYFILTAARIVHTFSNKKQKYGGSVPGHNVIYRDREGEHKGCFKIIGG